MPLPAGARLGSYEIVAPIGAGGMGEVYRARDAKLDRDVAIKILPELFASDPERLARFEREARSLASLNHPHIAQIYGLVEHAGGAPAIVMELVEGEDLAARVARGPIRLAEALPIARQIAEALEAAHERGIVHRDLKPANVKLASDDSVKVLDFGLAKAADGARAAAPDAMNSPTVTSASTRMGVILGTAAYMAPEQAKGKPIDKRVDIWAFGCVLYEMLAGRPLFAADTLSETIAAVLRADVDLSALPAATPTAVRRLLERLLERDPHLRLRDIGEARILLSSPAAASVETPRASRRGSLAIVITLAGALAGAGLASLWWRAQGADAPDAAQRVSMRRITELPGAELQADVSPDGRQVVFASAAAGNLDIYVLRVGGGRALNLTAGERYDDQQPAFSPDGERIAFRSERGGGGIFVMGATGESVRRVADGGYDPAWSPDGRRLAYATEPVVNPNARNTLSELWLADVSTGEKTRLLEGDAVQPAWSPDGTRIAYWANKEGQRDIWVVAAGGGTPTPITQDVATDWSPEWAPDGRTIYFSSDRGGTMNIWRVAVDPQSGRAAGEPEPVTSGVTDLGYGRLSADGRRLVVAAQSRGYELSTAPLEVGGALARAGPPATVRSTTLGWCAISPDDGWLACTSLGAQEDIVLMRTDGSETVRLTDDPVKDRNPVWSPDGQTVGFMSMRSGGWEQWSVRRDGSNLRQMTELRASVYRALLDTPGRRALAVSRRGEAELSPFGVWLFDASSTATRATARFLRPSTTERFSAESWSPDGKRIAGSIVAPSGGPQAIAVWNFPDGAVRTFDLPAPIEALDFIVAGWLPDDSRFVAASGDGVVIVDARTGAARPVTGVPPARRYSLSADGRTLFYERVVLDGDVWLLELAR